MLKLLHLKAWQVIFIIYGPVMAFMLASWITSDEEAKATFQVIGGSWGVATATIWYWVVGHFVYKQSRQTNAWELWLLKITLLGMVVVESLRLMELLLYFFSPETLHQLPSLNLADRLILITALAILYRAIFVTRYFKLLEFDRRTSGPDTVILFIALLLTPIGIFMLQPKLNRLNIETQRQPDLDLSTDNQ